MLGLFLLLTMMVGGPTDGPTDTGEEHFEERRSPRLQARQGSWVRVHDIVFETKELALEHIRREGFFRWLGECQPLPRDTRRVGENGQRPIVRSPRKNTGTTILEMVLSFPTKPC